MVRKTSELSGTVLMCKKSKQSEITSFQLIREAYYTAPVSWVYYDTDLGIRCRYTRQNHSVEGIRIKCFKYESVSTATLLMFDLAFFYMTLLKYGILALLMLSS